MAGEVCGAFSGAVLAIGLLYGEEQPEAATHLTEEFMRKFSERNGAVRCIDIIGFNIGSVNTEFEIASPKDFFLFLARGGKRTCNKVLRNSVEVLLEELNEWES
jgi:C_GCAxxG_C_C family probable redox protein